MYANRNTKQCSFKFDKNFKDKKQNTFLQKNCRFSWRWLLMKQWVKFTPVQGSRAHDPEVAVGGGVLDSRLKRLK